MISAVDWELDTDGSVEMNVSLPSVVKERPAPLLELFADVRKFSDAAALSNILKSFHSGDMGGIAAALDGEFLPEENEEETEIIDEDDERYATVAISKLATIDDFMPINEVLG